MRRFFLLLLFLFPITGMVANAADRDDRQAQELKLHTALRLIESFYVDSVNTPEIVEKAITAMLKELDPHSSYTNAEETRAFSEPLAGNFSGIGIRFQMLRDTVYVIEVIPGGPSQKSGIVAGDRIISCNDTILSGRGMKNTDILPILRGPKGSTANLAVKRGRSDNLLNFKLKREAIPINSVDFAYMVNDSVGIISLTRFAETSTAEFTDALNKLSRQGMRHLIIDLTGNGGGILRQATEIANIFLHKGDTLVSTRSSRDYPLVFEATHDGKLTEGRVAVMVNHLSASASEILAGALSDNDRAVIVGTRTFGKGLVQRPFPFADGSMIRLTVSRYYTPSGRCIQKPYTAGHNDDYEADILQRLSSGELMHADSIHITDSTVYRTLRLGRPVYGGGGIIPDVFVPLDTTIVTPGYRNLVAKGVLSTFVTSYVDNHRKELRKKYVNEDAFVSEPIPGVDDQIFKDLLTAASAEGIEFDEEQLAVSAPIVGRALKALIGRDLFNTDTYYKIMNPANPTFVEALEVINSPERYNSYLSSPTPKQ